MDPTWRRISYVFAVHCVISWKVFVRLSVLIDCLFVLQVFKLSEFKKIANSKMVVARMQFKLSAAAFQCILPKSKWKDMFMLIISSVSFHYVFLYVSILCIADQSLRKCIRSNWNRIETSTRAMRGFRGSHDRRRAHVQGCGKQWKSL